MTPNQDREIQAAFDGFVKPEEWRSVETEPAPQDGSHIEVCNGPYDQHWGFDQSPPAVVHYWCNPGEEGFYLSHGLVEGSYNDAPFKFTHWRRLGATPR